MAAGNHLSILGTKKHTEKDISQQNCGQLKITKLQTVGLFGNTLNWLSSKFRLDSDESKPVSF